MDIVCQMILFVPTSITRLSGFSFNNWSRFFTIVSLIPPGMFLTVNLWDFLNPFSDILLNMESPVTTILYYITEFWMIFPCRWIRSSKVLFFSSKENLQLHFFQSNAFLSWLPCFSRDQLLRSFNFKVHKKFF